jgi:hypothetical protein
MGDEAETAFAHAKELYAAALPQFKPGTELALRGRRSNEYVSIMRMRRAGEDETVIAAAAYQVLGRSLQQVAPRRSFFETVGSYRKGIAAEDIIASLLARKGTAPYISSEREGRGGSYDREVLRLVSDFHIIRNNKVPIEVKYATETVTAGYDRSKILVVKYLPMVCEPMMREWPTLYPDVQTAAVHVARLLIEESVGNTALSAEEHAVLDLASVIVDNIVNEWLAQREQDRDIQ